MVDVLEANQASQSSELFFQGFGVFATNKLDQGSTSGSQAQNEACECAHASRPSAVGAALVRHIGTTESARVAPAHIAFERPGSEQSVEPAFLKGF